MPSEISSTDTVPLDEESYYPEVDNNIWSNVQKAPGWNTAEFNEKTVFDQMYDEVIRTYYPDAVDVAAEGRQILKLFRRWKSVTERFVQHVLHNSENLDDPIQANLDWDAEGGGEAIIRPIQEKTGSNVSYFQTPTAEGKFNIFPDETAGDDVSFTPTENEQALIILGYVEFANPGNAVFDFTQAKVNDSIGARRPFYIRNAIDFHDTLKVAERHRGPLLVEPGDEIDIDANVIQTDTKTGLFPVGVEVVRADHPTFPAILD
jgi:hypothetical protein